MAGLRDANRCYGHGNYRQPDNTSAFCPTNISPPGSNSPAEEIPRHKIGGQCQADDQFTSAHQRAIPRLSTSIVNPRIKPSNTGKTIGFLEPQSPRNNNAIHSHQINDRSSWHQRKWSHMANRTDKAAQRSLCRILLSRLRVMG